MKDRTPVVSQANGNFSFPIPAKSFYLINVQKQGHVLTDPEVLSKQYSYSANDLIIVREDLAQQEADRRAIERKISGKLYAQLLRQGEELDDLREQNKITEEKYRDLLQQLNQYQDDNEKIIKDMADRVINLCEMKFVNKEFEVKADYEMQLRERLQWMIDHVSSTHNVQMTLVTTYGLKYGIHSGVFQRTVTLDSLFEPAN